MKNFRLLCILAIMTGFSAISTIDKADREKIKADNEKSQKEDTATVHKKEAQTTAQSENNNSETESQNSNSETESNENSSFKEEQILPKIRIFQKISEAFPRTVSNFVAMQKGLATFSSEPQEVKDCAMAIAMLIEESQKITTEDESQEFAQRLSKQIEQCNAAIESEEIDKNGSNLPYVKIAQQVMEAFPIETLSLIRFMIMQSMSPQSSLEAKIAVHEALELLSQIKDIKTEEQTQIFYKNLLEKINEYRISLKFQVVKVPNNNTTLR